jgi:hypothetical protein
MSVAEVYDPGLKEASYNYSESELTMFIKLFGGLAIAAGLIAAGVAGTSSDDAKKVSCCSDKAKAACCSEDCCKDCPDCSCDCACCDDCTNGCECPNKQ